VADHLGIDITAHQAYSDIEATYQIGRVIIEKLVGIDGTLLDWKKEMDANA